MSYVNFKALVKKINLKPNGIQEIVIEASGGELKGQLEKLARMIDHHAQIEIESTIVNYNVKIDSSTKKPLIEYRVDENGVIHEVKTSEQLELPGLPKKEVKIEDETKSIDREIVDQFVLSGMAPTFDDLPKNIDEIAKRRIEGDSYITLANVLEMSSGRVVEIIEDYRKRIAPLAQKWWEWKQNNEDQKDDHSDDTENGNENDAA
ncbi:2-methylcitrate dehydratase [Fervidibacillus albus]|uniref:2-methylcitrate dehydratase n=1 Tax=Fervidibacillus albus TaxID=2980026 RepID=A0A9E8LW69_9BACI|nr:2-methylcitrate dehydratase [Fervidibacillus albus]WAA10823.1 2-methylcitrate dehydratase [Fervidibacillus albus]